MKKNKPKNFDNLLKTSINAADDMINGNEEDLSMINDYLSEYLKSFCLLGYDTKGESVVILAGKTAQDYDAIETLLRRISNVDFFNNIQEEKSKSNE